MEKLTPSQAHARMKHYCAYQERCHWEVRNKLDGYGLERAATEKIITQLISEDYLNEARFAQQFASGKFRLKGWGKRKIALELKARQVSEYCISKGLEQIDHNEYEDTFYRLAEKKRLSLAGEKNIFIRKTKIRDFLLSKGYSHQMVYTYLEQTY